MRLSDGLPGRINQMANVLLVKLESGGFSQGRVGFPRVHVSVLALVVILTVLALLLFMDEDSGVDERQDVVDMPVPGLSGKAAGEEEPKAVLPRAESTPAAEDDTPALATAAAGSPLPKPDPELQPAPPVAAAEVILESPAEPVEESKPVASTPPEAAGSRRSRGTPRRRAS